MNTVWTYHSFWVLARSQHHQGCWAGSQWTWLPSYHLHTGKHRHTRNKKESRNTGKIGLKHHAILLYFTLVWSYSPQETSQIHSGEPTQDRQDKDYTHIYCNEACQKQKIDVLMYPFCVSQIHDYVSCEDCMWKTSQSCLLKKNKYLSHVVFISKCITISMHCT